MKAMLKELNACQEAIEWAENKSIEEIINTCHRGDWLLWLAKKLKVDIRPLTLAKGLCANTVRYLMKDERSLNAVDVAISFGMGTATREELDNAASYAAAYAAAAYAAAADAASAAAAASAYAAAAAAAKKANQQQTADICREVLGEILIKKCLTFKSESNESHD